MTAEVVQPFGRIVSIFIVIKGEIRGPRSLIDGEVQGSIHVVDGRVTIGPHGKISADVEAREIVIRGNCQGFTAPGPIASKWDATGNIRGGITTLRIAIEEGAQVHSKSRSRAVRFAEHSPQRKITRVSSLQPLTMKAGSDARTEMSLFDKLRSGNSQNFPRPALASARGRVATAASARR